VAKTPTGVIMEARAERKRKGSSVSGKPILGKAINSPARLYCSGAKRKGKGRNIGGEKKGEGVRARKKRRNELGLY